MTSRCAVIVTIFVATVLLTGYQAHAQPATSILCNDRLIKGTYAFTVQGELLIAPVPLLVKGVGMITFDGEGGLTQVDSVTINAEGPGNFGNSATGTYHVSNDCTGTFTIVFSNPPNEVSALTVNFVVSSGGLEIETVVVGVCIENASPPCDTPGVSSVRSSFKKRFPLLRN
jgi:hypothetical protein